MGNQLRHCVTRALRTCLVAAGLLGATPTVDAQTNPNVVEFLPSAEHALLLSNGQPVVSRYELLVYQSGTVNQYLRVDLGKPAPQADGMIRVDFGKLVSAWPYPNLQSDARVSAIGPNGTAVSTPSNSFVYACSFSLSSSGRQFAATSGTGSVNMTTASQCGWTATSSAGWITVTAGASGAGAGTVSYSVAANSGATRTGTLTIGGITYTVAQAASGSGSGGSSTTTFLSDLPWTSMTNGWGPVERDRSNGETGASDGGIITLNGSTYAKGLGAHAGSEIRFPLNGVCSMFEAEIGVDDEVGSNGSVVFQIRADGVQIYDSGTMTGTTSTLSLMQFIPGAQELVLLITDAGDGPGFDHGDWANARITCDSTTTAPPPPPPDTKSVRYLSDIPWISASNGWGPVERDRSNGEQKAGDGRTLTLNGIIYPKGLGAHANSDIRFGLNGTCSLFQAEIGVDDEVGSNGSVVFQVLADGTKLFDSGLMTGATPTRLVQVDISGRNELALIIRDGGDNRRFDHADWAGARITCSASAPAPTTTQVYLSDRTWTSMTNGWGPVEKDQSNGEQGDPDGGLITLNGQSYQKGLGAHAQSEIVYTLNGACSFFQADLGVDDEVGSNGSVIFQVWADGARLYDSGIMTGVTPTAVVNVDVAGRTELRLVITDAGDGNAFDHADWAGARVTCTSGGF